MLYISVVMGLLVGVLVHYALTVGKVKPLKAIIASVAVFVAVALLTYFGKLAHF